MLMAVPGRRALGGALVALVCLIIGCRARPTQSPRVPDGDPIRGQELIQVYGCSSCHVVPGVREARSLVGPPLTDWADRVYIAGRLTNEPDNLIRWIQFPQEVDPGNAMPDMGVTPGDARDIAAYLYTIQRSGRRRPSVVGGDAGMDRAVTLGVSEMMAGVGATKEGDGG